MKKKILLVEYATSTIETIKEILSHPIFEITTAHEGDEAKKRLAEKQFDLMITAAMLPKFHGFSLCQYAAETYPGIKIIIISHIYKGVEYKHQAISQYRANDFFEIPFDKEELKNRALELLEIKEEDLILRADKSTTQAPVPDTRKIPTLKKLQEEEKENGLTSEDLFGDIIQQVQKEPPPFEIKLNGEESRQQPPSPPVPPVTQVLTKEELPWEMEKDVSPTTQVLKQPQSAATQKIDMDLLNLLQADKKEKKKKEKEKLKKIEDDISQKLEDTLSGLGISTGKTAVSKKEKEPVKPPQVQVETKDEADEISGYEILGQIGRGGMAEVYKAKKKGVKGFEKIIALKKILSGYGEDDKYLEMFVDEAKIAAQLSHANIVQIYDLGKKDDYYFIAMEYVPGKDLRVVLNKLARESVTIPEELAIYLVINILAALNYAHSAKDNNGKRLDIVHRDVSPPNILVSYNGNIKLTDFGVSKASIKMHQTLAGALKGKILYMSPEQARGENNIDYRSDLYSVGIILFELITGKKLFLGSSEMVTLKKVQEGKIIKPSQIKRGIEPELEAIILKALEKNIKKRYQKASEMIKDLDAYMMKHYDSMPESSHLAYFIYTLFKEEITKEGIEVNIHAIPRPIKKIKREIEKETELIPAVEAEEPPSDEILELTQEEAIPLDEEMVQEQDSEYPELEARIEEVELPETEDFHPIIEINLEEDQVKEEDKKEIPEREVVLSQIDALEQEKDSKKKRNLLLVLFLLLIVLAIVIGVFVIDSLTTGKIETGPAMQPQPAEAYTPPPKEGEITTETDTTTGTDTDTDSGISTDAPTGEKISQPKDQDKAQKDEDALLKKSKYQDQPQQEQIDIVPPKKPKKRDKKEKKKPSQLTEPEAGIVSKESREKPAATEQEQKKDSESPKKEETPPKETAVSPPPAVKEGDILSASTVDTNAVPISEQKIEVSRSIRRLMLTDQRVFVTFLVDHNGNVEDVKIIRKSSLKKLNALIVESVKQWKFKPATKNNVKVKIWKSKLFVIKK
ncbi:MAG: TonB family protein [Candidatus Aminicenantes bacterium]|nr:TonB family protein [Candidatus Aminicenantes bacterium]NIM81509.1 TonB family protein [Candidatus Aminicenantes bacterium]NIN20879.1 TonB family protein [Candidatus Aminicenantes bacterium]NIN44700.1 TonB family protein [Candidatus Aminicenantes bacterium]NIN87508.1 TonB family protein [Candidatus Aminicenantes bacterium]